MSKIIETKKGLLQGIDEGTYTVFKGIPYAKPPVGELRWKAPQETEPWEGIKIADHFENMCEQELPTADVPWGAMYYKEFYSYPEFLPPMGEDCLYLNIWIPNESSEEKLPVAFWIHGGGFGGGYSSEIEFDGKKFCEKGVIFVSIEYRTNIYGFFAHPWLTEENEQKISGNYGILDQIAALNWVYENIAAFGGDPENITVFGQSAGSMSTQILVSSELTKGKIAKAILQSGITCEENVLFCPTLQEEEAIGVKIAKRTKAKSLEELRKIDPEHLRRARMMVEAEYWQLRGDGIVVVPNTDNYVLKETVKDVWKKGTMHDIPYMIGSTGNDLGMTPEEIANGDPGILQTEAKRWCEKREEVSKKPCYVYWFTHKLPGDDNGCFHSSEIWYMQGTLDRCWRPMTEEDYRLSEKMITYWTNFMKDGDPGCAGEESWPAYTAQDPYIKTFE